MSQLQYSPRLPLSALLASLVIGAAAVTPSALDAQTAASRVAEGSLSTGIVRVGDRIVLIVEDEEALTDTFTVKAGPFIDLPVIGEIQLAGVRRNEIQSHLTKEIGRFIRNPMVRATTLVRIAVLGQVTESGYFALPADALLSDVINEAGGPTVEAEMRKIQLHRNGKVIRQGAGLQRDIAVGRTLDELGLQAGDEVFIPRRRDADRTVRILSTLILIPFTILALNRM